LVDKLRRFTVFLQSLFCLPSKGFQDIIHRCS